MGARRTMLDRAPPAEGMNAGLIEWLASVQDDPLAFAMGAWPWGEEGTILAKYPRPLDWQCEIMEDIRRGIITLSEAMQRIDDHPDDGELDQGEPIQLATASGHGVGKSALVSMLI